MAKSNGGMSVELQEECKVLIKKYRGYKRDSYKIKARNELYEKLCPWLLIWIKSILSSWKKWERKEKIISLSWDAFLWCLERHNGSDVHLAEYFYNFTRYYLLNNYARKNSVKLPVEELTEILNLVDSAENNSFTNLLTIVNFFEHVVPEHHMFIFNDSMFCINGRNEDKMRSWSAESGVTRSTYEELRKIYTNIIKWIVGL